MEIKEKNQQEQDNTENSYPLMKIYDEFCKKPMDLSDSYENEYKTINDLWRKELDPVYIKLEKEDPLGTNGDPLKGYRIGSHQNWYKKGEEYWDKQPTTVDGVLGGYGQYHEMEAKYSDTILKQFIDKLPGTNNALEAGGGIGRISKTILSNYFENIDLQDQSKAQFEQAKLNAPFIKNFYFCGFQDFQFEKKYDCIWLQWFLMYLKDDDLIKILNRCRQNLTFDQETGESGIIVVKENIKSKGAYLDKEDHSLIRSPIYFQTIFETCGLEVVHSSYQIGWPKDLFALMLWVLKAKKIKS